MVKLVFFDMDGTIFNHGLTNSYGNTAPSLWTVIAKHLGQKAWDEEEETKRKWTRGEYDNYIHWMRDTIDIYRKYGLEEDFFRKVVAEVMYFDGVAEVMAELRKRGLILAIISGGFKALADRCQRDFGIDHAFSACELFFEDGKMAYWNLLPTDYEGKVSFMHLMMKEYKLSKEDCAFVADGRNDIPLAKEVGVSISFNGAPELEAVTTHKIKQKKADFAEVLKFL